MWKWGLVIIIMFSFEIQAFESCRMYFSGNFSSRKNIPLSKMMQSLQEHIWEMDSFLLKARNGEVLEENYKLALRHAEGFVRIANAMHERHDSQLAPSRVFNLESERQDAYLKMYSRYTQMFLEMSQEMLLAFQEGRWQDASSLLEQIHSFSAEAHMKVDSNNF